MTNTSVNPAARSARRCSPASAAIGQLWLFILAPLVGAALAGYGYHAVVGQEERRSLHSKSHGGLRPLLLSVPTLHDEVPLGVIRGGDGVGSGAA